MFSWLHILLMFFRCFNFGLHFRFLLAYFLECLGTLEIKLTLDGGTVFTLGMFFPDLIPRLVFATVVFDKF